MPEETLNEEPTTPVDPISETDAPPADEGPPTSRHGIPRTPDEGVLQTDGAEGESPDVAEDQGDRQIDGPPEDEPPPEVIDSGSRPPDPNAPKSPLVDRAQFDEPHPVGTEGEAIASFDEIFAATRYDVLKLVCRRKRSLPPSDFDRWLREEMLEAENAVS